eukprot:TRINITY_DN6436_c0_g1_i1.p1 TRINITY_DN6436_c0_g1~~TRINITY_DN6436_c0_g1_i1.p1  ORF type:complete len:273 (-),score=51.71 TRINITY_DN6436_c0_g1_i1:410-1228(-)
MAFVVKRRNIRDRFIKSDIQGSDFHKFNTLFLDEYIHIENDVRETLAEIYDHSDGIFKVDVWIRVFGFIEVRDVYSVLCVSKWMHRVVSFDVVWERLYRCCFGGLGVFGQVIASDEGMPWRERFYERYTQAIAFDIMYMKERDEITANWDAIILCIYDTYLFAYRYVEWELPKREIKNRLLSQPLLPEPLKKMKLEDCEITTSNPLFSTKKKLLVTNMYTKEKFCLGTDSENQRKNWEQLLINRIRILKSQKDWHNFKAFYYVPESQISNWE